MAWHGSGAVSQADSSSVPRPDLVCDVRACLLPSLCWGQGRGNRSTGVVPVSALLEGSWTLMLYVGCWLLVVGCWMWDVGCVPVRQGSGAERAGAGSRLGLVLVL